MLTCSLQANAKSIIPCSMLSDGASFCSSAILSFISLRTRAISSSSFERSDCNISLTLARGMRTNVEPPKDNTHSFEGGGACSAEGSSDEGGDDKAAAEEDNDVEEDADAVRLLAPAEAAPDAAGFFFSRNVASACVHS